MTVSTNRWHPIRLTSVRGIETQPRSLLVVERPNAGLVGEPAGPISYAAFGRGICFRHCQRAMRHQSGASFLLELRQCGGVGSLERESPVRNIFDQYEQPENRLTHALATVLDQDRDLLHPFLRWLGVDDIPKPRLLKLTQQQVPGAAQDDADTMEQRGLPDASVFDNDGWAVLFECKVQAKTTSGQLQRHRATAQRNGFESPWIIALAVDDFPRKLPDKTICRTWREVYSWFNSRSSISYWAGQLADYMRTFERKMLARDYQIRGPPDRHRLFFGRGMVSDDTEHTCMVAQSLIASGDDVDQFARQFGRRLRWWLLALPAGIGKATLRASVKLWFGVSPTSSGVFSAATPTTRCRW